MRQESLLNQRDYNRSQQMSIQESHFPKPTSLMNRISKVMANTPRHTIIGALLILALLAFEVFNFDTTQFALGDLLGETNFFSVRWATILAVAFCAIDFAGLAYLFGPDRNSQRHHEVWYLMGAWLLGATMNALMTWWAVSLTLLDHQNGNVILTHEELLGIVPMLVAVLVWLTRILFIGAFSAAGGHIFGVSHGAAQGSRPVRSGQVTLMGAESIGASGGIQGAGQVATQMPTAVGARAAAKGHVQHQPKRRRL